MDTRGYSMERRDGAERQNTNAPDDGGDITHTLIR